MPAFAGCETGYDYAVTAKADTWMLTDTYSSWLAGPGTIRYSVTKTAMRGTQKDASITIGASGVILKAEAKYGMNWSESTSRASTWTYDVPVPSGQTARAGVYKRGSRFTVAKYFFNATCGTEYKGSYYQYSPYAGTDNSQFCIGKDPYPGTQFVMNTTCAH